jgi:crossover junction endodeoxyribonuclease RuvC
VKTILGLDPGLAETGWGIFTVDNGRYRLVDHGVIHTSPGEGTGDRLEKIYREVQNVIDRFSPSAAGVESIFFARNRTSAIPVAQARGVLLLALHQRGVAIFEYSPQEIKRAITGNGRADKFQVQGLLKLLLGLKEIPKPDHAADAIAAAICCYNQGVSIERIGELPS